MTGNEIIEAVRDLLSREGAHVIPPLEDGSKAWDDANDPLVLIVDPVNHCLTAVRLSHCREAEQRGQTT